MPTLSSRLDEALRAQIVQRAAATLAEARAAKKTHPRAWAVGLSALVGLAMAAGHLTGASGHARSGVPFGPATVISAESQGLGSAVEELLPGEPSSRAGAEQSVPAHANEAAVEGRLSRAATSSRQRPQTNVVHEGVREPWWEGGAVRSSPACATCPARPMDENSLDVLFEAVPEAPGSQDAQPQPSARLVINVGSRFDIVLEFPVLAGAFRSPVSARTTADVLIEQRAALPKGTAVVGEAIASDGDDRVQILLTALILKGTTIPFHGMALGPDSAFGVPGKVLRKGSRRKASAGRFFAGVGPALASGILGNGQGLVDSAAGAVVGGAGHELAAASGGWSQRSEKIIQLAAGLKMTVYVRQDLII